MKAVIPAAGEGKRFNKDSTYMHKCLVPINGKALLLYTLENLTNIKEITECIVIIGENHEKIIDTIGTKVNDTPILFCKQKQSVKGVVGAIESAVEEIGNDDFILVLADEFVYENNYAEAIEKFKTSTNECMVGLYYEKHLEYVKKNYTFIKSPDGFLYNFIEKPQIVYNNCSGTGNIIFKNTVLGAIKKVKENKERHEKELVDLLNLICATGKIQSFVVGNYYCNVNNMNDYLRIIEFLEGERNDLANGRITVGQFTIIFTYMGIALSNTNLILTFGQTYQNTKTSYNRIKELYQLELREDGLLKKETVNFIEAKDISYIFENGNGLNKISADFQKGKRYLICGSNGAGKTTFINILIRQYKSLSGDIFIDNINIKKINYEQLRLNCFSVMNQEQKFPSVSVVEYINLSNNTEYSTREIIDRLIMKDMYNIAMDIHEVLEKETQNINMLSGGEKQKVELVKTILKDADVYFFDEPTAHLDQESRDEYYQYLKKQKDKIIVVVSHNSQERQYFDVIYEV